jgi:hypothetical protein
VAAIQKINYEHNQLREAIPASAADREQQWAAIKAREAQRIASILTPAEFANYQRRQAGMATGEGAPAVPGPN